LTELNIELNTKHRRYLALQEEKNKIHELLVKHDEEKLGITRALQAKLDEKTAKILKYEQHLKNLEANSGEVNKNLERNFRNEISDMQFKHEKQMNQRQDQMQTLDSNLEVLNNFKDSKQAREENLKRESRRYEMLKRELEMLKRNGKAEMEF
jgi:hypothetical protein